MALDGFSIGDTVPLSVSPADDFSTVTVAVRRRATGNYLDFADNTFKAAGTAATQSQALAVQGEEWLYSWDTTGIDDGGALTDKQNLSVEYTIDGEQAAEDLNLGYGGGSGGGATAQEVWEYLISGSQAQTYLTQLVADTSIIDLSFTRLAEALTDYADVFPAYKLDGAAGVTASASRTLAAGEIVTLISVPISTTDTETVLGYFNDTGWHSDAGWVDTSNTTGRRYLLAEYDLAEDAVFHFIFSTTGGTIPGELDVWVNAYAGYHYGAIGLDGSLRGGYGARGTAFTLLADDFTTRTVDVNTDGEVAIQGGITDFSVLEDDIKYIKYRVRFPNKKGLHG